MQATTTNPLWVAAARLAHQILTQSSPETNMLLSPTRRLQQHLLYFDDGSNPGPGGSGSVIVRLGGHAVKPEIVWMASVSYAHRTTNNAAEYQGLLVGLRHTMLKPLHGLNVIGNNNLIDNNFATDGSPARGIYKMADGLANLAMDTKKSTQVFEEDLSNLPQT
ncbi:Ribonuclease HI [Phytophthora megakarya]|uniref:Ribonuclease HI n=1 Tax=Phytophthora megakarya TaxID=4795 RepID=A0A225W0B9_9STRA|nr:Ribonuclease HI [Phytophthora megakarya]